MFFFDWVGVDYSRTSDLATRTSSCSTLESCLVVMRMDRRGVTSCFIGFGLLRFILPHVCCLGTLLIPFYTLHYFSCIDDHLCPISKDIIDNKLVLTFFFFFYFSKKKLLSLVIKFYK